jgi:hypothetical protein
MEGTVSAPPQRVCPKCARISWATGPRCPYCRARFRRQNLTAFAWMLAAAVLVTLAGVLVIILIVGGRVEDHVNDRADEIQREFNDIQREIDRRLPPAGAVPSATAFPTPTPPPATTATPTPTPSPSATATPSATNTPSSNSGDTGEGNTETRP